jgi:hypothetical protein
LNGCQSTKADPQERKSVAEKKNEKEEIMAKVILETTRVEIA